MFCLNPFHPPPPPGHFGSSQARKAFLFIISLAFATMATSAPLLGKEGKAAHSKASIFYGADEYLEELRGQDDTSTMVAPGCPVVDTGQGTAKCWMVALAHYLAPGFSYDHLSCTARVHADLGQQRLGRRAGCKLWDPRCRHLHRLASVCSLCESKPTVEEVWVSSSASGQASLGCLTAPC